jgi:UDPglucose 6-dehydrogenase
MEKHLSPKIGIIGIGMVGTPLARYFEERRGYKRGKNLFLYDTDVRKNFLDDINQGDIIFICVPTPRNPKDGSCDVSIVQDAIRKIKGSKIVVIRSTVPPGTTEAVQKENPRHKLLFNPEFLTESRAWEDMIRPDRQIVGFTEASIDAAHVVLSLLPKAPFMSPWGIGTYHPVRITATEAELIKYAANVYFVRKVNWANALAKASEKIGATYEKVRQGMAADHRIGDSHLDVEHGGYRGWGGYCFPKDTAAFMSFAKKNGLSDVAHLLQADWDFNEELLKEQGLSIDGVSKHITEQNITIAKPRKAHRK